MVNEKTTKKLGLRAKVAAALAVSAGLVLGGAVPAFAGDAICTPAGSINCGQIRNNAGSVTVTVATNYVNSTTVSGIQKSLPANTSTMTSPYMSGQNYRDWDAFYIPAGSCAILYTGALLAFPSTNDRVGKSGVWHKVDNLGARIKVKAGSCPTW